LTIDIVFCINSRFWKEFLFSLKGPVVKVNEKDLFEDGNDEVFIIGVELRKIMVLFMKIKYN
jgi:hypothetical protein